MLVSSPAAEAVSSRCPPPLAAIRGARTRAACTWASTCTANDRSQSRSSPRSRPSATPAFTPLVLASVWAPALRLGTAIAPVFTRGPATLAQCAASLAAAAPGRVAIGIGASSDVIVERWNGVPFDRPLPRVRDTARFLRAALAGDKVTHRYETFAVDS